MTLVADRPREPVKSPPSGKLLQVAGCGRIFAGVGHGQGPGRLAQSPVRPRLPLRNDERREGTDADVHRLTSRGQNNLEHEHVVGRLVVADARLPRRIQSPSSLDLCPAERIGLILTRPALVAREFLKVADIDHRQVHADLPHGFQLVPNGLDGPLVRHGQFVMNCQAHIANIPRHKAER